MSDIIRFASGEGPGVLVEVDQAGGWEPFANEEPGVSGRARRSLQTAVEGIAPAIRCLLDEVRAAGDGVQAVELQFGLKLSGEAGAFIAKTAAEGHWQVTVSWGRP